MSRPPGPNDVGLRLVILYKSVKGALELAASALLALGIAFGLAEYLQDVIDRVHSHLTRAWSILLAEKVFVFATRHHLVLAAIALALDGSLTTFEGWGLHKRRWWAPWLVVIASGTLLPFEIRELMRGVKITRVLVLVVNLAIVVYLARRIAREHAEMQHARDLEERTDAG